MRANEFLKESDGGSAGGTTTSGNFATNPAPIGNKPGKNGKAPKPFKVKSVNATTSNVNIFGAVGETQAMPVIKR